MNNKRILYIVLLFIIVFFSSCARNDPYKWEGHSYQELRIFFQERFDEFQKVADIIAGSQEFWEKGRRYPEEEGSAWIMSPNDEKKMTLFSDKDQSVIIDFFNATKPYMITLRYNRYVIIDYINEDKTGSYTFVYYPYKNGEYDELKRWQESVKLDYGNLDQLRNMWYMYINTN